MKVESLYIGQKVRHPQYGTGVVTAITEQSVDIQFNDLKRTLAPQTSEIQPAEAQATFAGLDIPLAQFVEQIVTSVVDRLGVDKPDSVVRELAARRRGGKVVLKPSDQHLQASEAELEVYCHKLVLL